MTCSCVRPRSILLLALGLLALSGCEEDVVPVLGTDEAYTVYGFFNPRETIQAVRVVPIDGVLVRTGTEPLDALVTSTEMETGTRTVWRDSLVLYPSGAYGHVFWSPFQAGYERTYRLEVERSDGARAVAEVAVPPESEPEVGEADPDEFDLIMPVLWRDAPWLIDADVRYVTKYGEDTWFYGTEQTVDADGSTVQVSFRRDTRAILQEAFASGFGRPEFCFVEMKVVVANREWAPPEGVFDPEVLVEPGTFSNVENGFGFVGAGYPAQVRWIPSDEVLQRAGFRIEADPEQSCQPNLGSGSGK